MRKNNKGRVTARSFDLLSAGASDDAQNRHFLIRKLHQFHVDQAVDPFAHNSDGVTVDPVKGIIGIISVEVGRICTTPANDAVMPPPPFR